MYKYVEDAIKKEAKDHRNIIIYSICVVVLIIILKIVGF